jgi:hypothetical protein
MEMFPAPARLVDLDDRATPQWLFDHWHGQYRFTVDVAASAANAKLPRFYDLNSDGLAASWAGERVWCNPPFSLIEPWAIKAWNEPAPVVALLVPANRTDQAWWARHIEPFRDGRRAARGGGAARAGVLTTHFLPGRPRFLRAGAEVVGPGERPPFGCAVLLWDRT